MLTVLLSISQMTDGKDETWSPTEMSVGEEAALVCDPPPLCSHRKCMFTFLILTTTSVEDIRDLCQWHSVIRVVFALSHSNDRDHQSFVISLSAALSKCMPTSLQYLHIARPLTHWKPLQQCSLIQIFVASLIELRPQSKKLSHCAK